MNKTVGTAMTGIALGLAAGTAAYAVSNMTTKSQRRKLKKTADKAMKNVGAIIDNVSYMMK